MKFNTILESIGNTAQVKINNLYNKKAEVWMKLERSNPGGSIKDRIALSMIENAEKNGLWIGSMSYGLLYCDLQTNKLSIIDAENNQINMLYKDEKGRVWYDHVEDLVCYDPQKKSIRKIKHPVPDQLPVWNYGNSLTEMVTFSGQLIISSDYGQVYSYNSLTEQFRLIFENR